jgi:hypothetical protein
MVPVTVCPILANGFAQLRELHVGGDFTLDLASLACRHTLTRLDCGCEVEDLTPLSKLEDLSLYMDDMGLPNLAPLAKCRTLKKLALSGIIIVSWST